MPEDCSMLAIVLVVYALLTSIQLPCSVWVAGPAVRIPVAIAEIAALHRAAAAARQGGHRCGARRRRREHLLRGGSWHLRSVQRSGPGQLIKLSIHVIAVQRPH